MIANYIIDGNAHRKGNTSINHLTIDFFGKKLGGLRGKDGVSKLAEINHLGTGQALRNNALQRQVDNLGGFLVFRTNVTD